VILPIAFASYRSIPVTSTAFPHYLITFVERWTRCIVAWAVVLERDLETFSNWWAPHPMPASTSATFSPVTMKSFTSTAKLIVAYPASHSPIRLKALTLNFVIILLVCAVAFAVSRAPLRRSRRLSNFLSLPTTVVRCSIGASLPILSNL